MPEHASRPRVAVIGGGISGLAAAHRLQQRLPEHEVHLFESADRLGGVIKTTEKDGFLIESAADNFITTTSAAIDLCRDLGIESELIRTNPGGGGAQVVSRGKLEPIPPGFMVMAPSRLWPLLVTKILSPMGKLRAACEAILPPRKKVEDESLESFVSRRFGTELFERLVQPLVGGIYTADPSRLSVGATMPRFLEMERQHGSLIRGMLASRRQNRRRTETRGGARYSQFMALRGGMSRLVEVLGRTVPANHLHLGTPVDQLAKTDKGWQIREGNRRSLDVRAVVLATPSRTSSRLLEPVDRVASSELADIEYASCAVVSLAFRRRQIARPLDAFGFVVPRVEGRSILSCSLSSEKYEGRAPEGTVLLRVFMGGALQPELLRQPDPQLIETAMADVAKLLAIRGKPILEHVTRQWDAMPQYHLGHRERIARVTERLAGLPTLALAGSALNGVGVPGCIESGQRAADQIAAGLRGNTGANQQLTGVA
ncbi:Protoporphyrinogen oxidase [Planctomycetes bacterium MalM25]|nr:Protoporphyrinogen oxidase [Planctomycetes bacterium MalM25]